MIETQWGREAAPQVDAEATANWHWELEAPADVTSSRMQLRQYLMDSEPASPITADEIDGLLLAFEELASNGIRHGRAPVAARVARDDSGWLIEVTDAAVNRPPVAAVDRDPAQGGLGLGLVSHLTTSHGWDIRQGRKYVWACLLSR